MIYNEKCQFELFARSIEIILVECNNKKFILGLSFEGKPGEVITLRIIEGLLQEEANIADGLSQ